jgi:hypothetical protein
MLMVLALFRMASHFPENDNLENMMPACALCNISKSSLPIEEWRKILENSTKCTQKNYPTVRNAIRFGLIEIKEISVVFFSEKHER